MYKRQTAALIHDDIADEAELRRGEPCMHCTEGIGLAINAGDLALSLVNGTVVEDPDLDDHTKVRVIIMDEEMCIRDSVVATVGIITQLADYGEADPQLWFGFLQMLGGSTAAVVAFCAFNLLCAPCFAAMGTIRQQQNSPKWFWITIGYLCGFALSLIHISWKWRVLRRAVGSQGSRIRRACAG